jgi:F-type H+-transporting ATPase subunit epsilon
MEENFNIEIIKPEKIIFSNKIKIATIPSFEGNMSILKDHISIITFLRPGIIKVEKNDGSLENFFVEDGTVEFFNNTLIILSSSAENTKDLTKNFLDNLNKITHDRLANKEISDQDRYTLNHKLDTIKEISI